MCQNIGQICELHLGHHEPDPEVIIFIIVPWLVISLGQNDRTSQGNSHVIECATGNHILINLLIRARDYAITDDITHIINELIYLPPTYNHIWMLNHKPILLLKPVGDSDIITIHSHYYIIACRFKPLLQRNTESLILLKTHHLIKIW